MQSKTVSNRYRLHTVDSGTSILLNSFKKFRTLHAKPQPCPAAKRAYSRNRLSASALFTGFLGQDPTTDLNFTLPQHDDCRFPPIDFFSIVRSGTSILLNTCTTYYISIGGVQHIVPNKRARRNTSLTTSKRKRVVPHLHRSTFPANKPNEKGTTEGLSFD